MMSPELQEFTQAKADFQALVDLAVLSGPPTPVRDADDCPGFGRELPPGWACQPDCPINQACYEDADE